MRDIVKIFKAVSDSNRVRILKMLELRPLCVCEITEVLQLAPSTVSKHLSILRDVDLILDNKDGKWVDYRLNQTCGNSTVKGVLTMIANRLNEDHTVTSDFKIVKAVDRDVICAS